MDPQYNIPLAICIPTFHNDRSLYDVVESIAQFRNPNWCIFIGDYGQKNEEKNEILNKIANEYKVLIRLYYCPYMCGHNITKNALVQQVYGYNIRYCLMMDDDIKFTFTMANLDNVLCFFEEATKCGAIGLSTNKEIQKCHRLKLVEDSHFIIKKSHEFVDGNLGRLTLCDIVNDFFIGRTEALLECPWDGDIKIGGSEDFFYRLKHLGWSVSHFDICDGRMTGINEEKNKYFNTIETERTILYLKKKYNLKDWIKYEE